jgi:hypothetical protein
LLSLDDICNSLLLYYGGQLRYSLRMYDHERLFLFLIGLLTECLKKLFISHVLALARLDLVLVKLDFVPEVQLGFCHI